MAARKQPRSGFPPSSGGGASQAGSAGASRSVALKETAVNTGAWNVPSATLTPRERA